MNIEKLEKLSEDENREVRFKVASNPNTPVYILEKLSEDENREVRSNVASKSNTPVYILEKLSEDEYFCVMWLIIQILWFISLF